jgi:hypothetical protein
MPNPLVAPVIGFLSKLSFPRLFAVTAALWVLTLFVPDPIPFVDEILLGLGTLLLGSLRRRKQPGVIDAPSKR